MDAGYFAELEGRRQKLRVSYQALAEQSGVSRPTVQRILSGRHPAASYANVASIVKALGYEITFVSRQDVQKMRTAQANQKAKKLVSLVQGTSGLEGQAVDSKAVQEMIEQTAVELLAGPGRKLWSEG